MNSEFKVKFLIIEHSLSHSHKEIKESFDSYIEAYNEAVDISSKSTEDKFYTIMEDYVYGSGHDKAI